MGGKKKETQTEEQDGTCKYCHGKGCTACDPRYLDDFAPGSLRLAAKERGTIRGEFLGKEVADAIRFIRKMAEDGHYECSVEYHNSLWKWLLCAGISCNRVKTLHSYKGQVRSPTHDVIEVSW